MTDVETIALPKWLAFMGPVLVALVTGLIAWLANRVVGKAAFQQAINTGFKGLLDTIRAEHQECQDRLGKLEEKYDAAKLRGTAERAQLRGEITNLSQIILSLSRILRLHGIPIPDGKLPTSLLNDGSDLVLFQEEATRDDQGS